MRAERIALAAHALALALLALLAGAAGAAAAPAWRVTSTHGPEQLPPGAPAGFAIQLSNVGDADSAGPVTVVDTLPDGLIATAARGAGWQCSGLGGGVVTCTTDAVVGAPLASASQRGLAATLEIAAGVPAGANGSGVNAVTVSGGGAPADAAASEPVSFGTSGAGFGVAPGSLVADAFAAPFPGEDPVRQAGAHPFELRVGFGMNLTLREDPDDPVAGDIFYTTPDEHIKTLEAKLPAGLIGNPQATPTCPAAQLYGTGPANKGSCPPDSQVGTIDLLLNNGKQLPPLNDVTDVPVYNMRPPPGTVAAFGFSYLSNTVWIVVTLDPGDHEAVVARIDDAIELLAVRGATLALWGVPGDPAHDPLRLDTGNRDPDSAMGTPFRSPIRPFLTLPSQCEAAGAVQLRMDSWQHPGAFTPWLPGAPAQMSGCADPRMRFQPSLRVQPQVSTPSTPTGLDVTLSVPQKDDRVPSAAQLYAGSGDDRAIATPPLRDTIVTLPAGLAISPSAANGLAACAPAQIALGSDQPPSCPDASKLGGVTLTTPLLADPLGGAVYLATQTANPFGSLLAVYLAIDGPGVLVKLPGELVADPVSGQLTISFRDDPQLPFSTLALHLDGGPRAPLVTGPACGVQTTTARLTAWNAALAPVDVTDSFAISGCAPGRFEPGFTAGSENPRAGASTPLLARVVRGDADEPLGALAVTLPRGLLGRIAALQLCTNADADAGRCGERARIGSATVAAGPGPDPFYVQDGRVYLTDGYRGGAFGLAIVVPARAGPFDLGAVTVRAAIHVDRTTTALRIVTDPLPRILQGIPLALRVAQVRVDRPGFARNPTSCAAQQVRAQISSFAGSVRTRTARFQLAGCAALPFHPRLTLSTRVAGRTRPGAPLALTARVTMGAGQANLHGVSVTLPGSLTALLSLVEHACTHAQLEAGDCEQARIGSASAVTPLLRAPERGGAYFVKNPAHKLPDLVIALRGQVDVDLVGSVRIVGQTRLAADFRAVPDVPLRRFALRLAGGRGATVAAAQDLCAPAARRARAQVSFRAQNGALVRAAPRLEVSGC